MSPRHVTFGTALVLGAALIGCGGGGGGGSRGSAAAAVSSNTPSATTSGVTAGTGSGSTTGGNGAVPGDVTPPALTLTSPARGEHTTQSMVRVEGTVTDTQSPVSYLLVNNTPVQVAASGTFTQVVPVTQGLNIIEIEAGDLSGNKTRSVLPVIAGAFQPEGRAVGDALAARLNRPAFDAAERLAEQQLAAVPVGTVIMAQNPLYDGGNFLANVQVNATGASIGAPDLELEPRAGALGVRAVIPNVEVRTRATGRLSGIPYGLTINVTATRATLTADAAVAVGANGAVTTTLTNVVVTLDGFRFDIRGIPTFLENLARNAVRTRVERMIRTQVERAVPGEVNKLIAGANGPITRTILGKPVTMRLTPTAVAFDVDGCSVRCDGDVSIPAVAGLPTTPGSLLTPGAPPAQGTTPALHLSLNDDLLNRVAFAAWRGGLMNVSINQASASSLGLPAALPLDAFTLVAFFPQLAAFARPGDPLEIEVSAGAPAILKPLAGGQAGTLEAGLGDVTISIYIAPAGQPRSLVLKAGTQVRLGVQPSVTNNRVQFAVVGQPTLLTDVFETPLVPLDQLAVETFMDTVLPPVVQLLPRLWSGFPLPVHPGLTPTNLQILPQGDFVTVRGDL
jgi:hypothetical protein